MAELKIMFWNIQNVYDFKIVTPAELVLEESISAPPEMRPGKRRRIVKSTVDFSQERNFDHRSTVAGIIDDVNPDIIVIVEFSVGKGDVKLSGTVPEGVEKTIKNARVEFDHWGPRQYQVTLNNLSDKLRRGRRWASSISQVNCSDIIAKLTEEGKINKIEHSNTMFELYGLLWDERKVEMVGKFEIDNRGVDGSSLHFPQRSPGVAWFKDKDSKREFLLIMIHSVFGKGSVVEVLKERSKPIKAIGQLAVVQKALKSTSPIVIAGDFNLDFLDSKNKKSFDPFLEDIKLKARINEKTSLGEPPIGSTKPYTVNAYDNIFTLNFANDSAQGGVKDFVRDEFGVEPPGTLGWDEDAFQMIENALKVSDHLPVFATLRFKS